jgi:hypothetical protein
LAGLAKGWADVEENGSAEGPDRTVKSDTEGTMKDAREGVASLWAAEADVAILIANGPESASSTSLRRLAERVIRDDDILAEKGVSGAMEECFWLILTKPGFETSLLLGRNGKYDLGGSADCWNTAGTSSMSSPFFSI